MNNRIFLLIALGVMACESDPMVKESDAVPGPRTDQQTTGGTSSEPVETIAPADSAAPGGLTLSVFMPPDSPLPTAAQKILEDRLLTVVTSDGIGGRGPNSRIAVVPVFNLVSKNITATAPTMHAVTCELTLHVADLETGTLFASELHELKGVGRDTEAAVINALGSIKRSEPAFRRMIGAARAKVIDYYASHCDEVINQATAAARGGDNRRAIGLLRSIPLQASACYERARSMAAPIIDAAVLADCSTIVSTMKAELGSTAGSDRGGYNAKAMAVYAMLPGNSPCRKEADAVYTAYIATLDRGAQERWEREERTARQQMKQQERDSELQTMKLRMEADVEKAVQGALLLKYKQDYEYGKMPWLRRLVHLGKYDPFDRSN